MKNSVEKTFPIIEKISSVYSHLLPDFFSSPFPVEELATCHNCPMCASTDEENILEQDTRFDNRYNSFYPDIKCCTFFPDIPNFLVGAVMSSSEPELVEGRKRLESIINTGMGVFPLGIYPPEEYVNSYLQYTDQTFGTNRSLLCPYYSLDKKKCSIWPYWQATCPTYFCKSVEGIAGKIFWDRLNNYLSRIEVKLAEFALQKLGLDIDAEDGSTSWGSWEDRKPEMYIRSYDIVSRLSRYNFEGIYGTHLLEELEDVKGAYEEATINNVSGILILNPQLKFTKLSDNRYLCDAKQGSSVLSVRVYDFVHFFDGTKAVEDVIENVLKDRNVRLTLQFILWLYKNKILIKM